MRRQHFTALALLLAALTALRTGAQPAYDPTTVLHAVGVVDFDWTDAQRDQRPVPVRIYYPTDAPGPFPVVIFSHGLGGSREGYEYLGRCWAGRGYVSVHLQHIGSDSGVWKGTLRPMQAMRKAAADPRNAADRARDVHFALDRLTQLNAEPSPLRGRLDMSRVGIAGHSFGAHTTLAAVGQGQALLSRFGLTAADPRIKAAIPMSAPAARGSLDEVYATIKVPCLHMTGTQDDSPIGDTTAAQRRIPYDHITAANQFLVTYQGGDHMIFARTGRSPERAQRDAEFHRLIGAGTTAFWDAYLAGNPAAEAWLKRGGYAQALGSLAKLEWK